MKKKTIALMMSLSLIAGCLVGCGDEDSGEATKATTATTASTTASATAPIQKPQPENVTVEHEHCGLRVKLDSTIEVGLDENNKNILTFSNDKISGTVAFAPLTELAGDATTSKEYAEGLKAQYGEDNARIGTSTNIAFYVIHEDDSGITVEALYIHGQNGWLVTARSADESMTNQLVKIVGLCSVNASQIPVA